MLLRLTQSDAQDEFTALSTPHFLLTNKNQNNYSKEAYKSSNRVI